jgi:nucleoside-diphosphate-sugar epimerase
VATAFVTGGSGFVGGELIDRLVSDGWKVRALARSDQSAVRVERRGAQAVRGDLTDRASLEAGAAGCDVCFHSAAEVSEWGPWEAFVRANVDGTRNVLEACRSAGVRRFVHVGTESAAMKGQALVQVDESTPLAPDSPAPYAATKAQAELLVRGFEGLETVVVRPRLVWGRGDATLLPAVVEAVRTGRWRWIGGGRHRTSTTHVVNCVEGLVLAAEKGRSGEAYFVTDGEPVVFRDFVERMAATQGLTIPDKGAPRALAAVAAPVSERIWRTLRLKSTPPLTRTAFWLSSQECTIRDDKAREELGYRPVMSIEDGLADMAVDRR